MLVSNTSTLILLAKISLLKKFVETHKKIEIPRGVYEESSKRKTFDWLLIAKEIEEMNIVICETEKAKTVWAMKEFGLDIDEAAAYALFDQKKHKALLTDDKELIKLCRIEGIPFTCAMAIVVDMFKKGEIKKEEARDKMRKLVTVGKYSTSIYDHFVKEVG